VIQIVRSMPEVAVVASYDEIAELPDKRFEDRREESLLYRLRYSAAPKRAGDILLTFQAMSSAEARRDTIRRNTAALTISIAGRLSFFGDDGKMKRTDPASTVDIAPTLAKEIGIQPEERLDGVALKLLGRGR
jgi:hypothetical protein